MVANSEQGILFDLTEFFERPHRTGIQRVCLHIVTNWKGMYPLIPIRVRDDGSADRLPSDVYRALVDFFAAPADELDVRRDALRRLAARPAAHLSMRAIARYRALLNAELFFCPDRIGFYERLLETLPDRIFMVIYDFLPWLRPEFFVQGSSLQGAAFVRLVRKAQHASFISEATRRDYLTRILRKQRSTGPVLSLGSDSFGFAEPRCTPGPAQFAVVGTLEPRKNHRAVLDAFESLWNDGYEASLVFIGKLGGTLSPQDRQRVERLAVTEPRFQWRVELDDHQVKEIIRESRSTIFASLAEGFGLPPLESLALGVPAIVSDSLPSVAMIDPLGQIRLRDATAPAIKQAVLKMLDDGFARQKAAEIRRLRLPTWTGMVREIQEWMEHELR
jgi:glycosyltransferase involved in cell wall biosynthesis